MKSIYKCPVCSEELHFQNRSWVCEGNHCFDTAREGYVNLLLAHQKKSKQAGDSKMMVQSRRRFLNHHHYDVLPDKLSSLCQQYFSDDAFSLLDIGCGEGYYSNFILQQMPACAMWGLDISKPAIAAAAKRYTDISFSVCSSYRLPIVDSGVDVVLKIYAPADESEIARVLTPGGLYISVTPGSSHLFGLKQLIYDTPREHDEDEVLPGGFELIEQVVLRESLHLKDNQDITDLLAMTPYYWHLPEARQQAIAVLTELQTEIHFVINIYKKH